MSVEYINPDKRTFILIRKAASCAHKLDYHYVFATKYRRPVLLDDVAEFIHTTIVDLCKERNWLLLGLSIQPDHMHLIFGLRPVEAPAQVAHDLKGVTSFKAIGAFPGLKDAIGTTQLWGKGYSVETLGRANVAQITAYLQGQDAHHFESMIDDT